MHAGRVGQQQRVITNLVHQPRHTVGGAIDALQRTSVNMRRDSPPAAAICARNVGRGLAAIERFQVAASRGPLAERLEPGARQMLFEQMAARQYQADARLAGHGDVRDQANLFQHAGRQRVGFIGHEQHARTAGVGRVSDDRPRPTACHRRAYCDREGRARTGSLAAKSAAYPCASCRA